MKRICLFLSLMLAVCAFCVSASAQENVSRRRSPQIIGHFGISGSPLRAGNRFKSSDYISGYGTMSSIYQDYNGNIMTTGTFIVGADIKFNRVIAVTVNLGLNVLWNNTYSGVTDEKTGTSYGVALYLMPMAKLYYMDRDIIRMYGTVGLGVGKYYGYPCDSDDTFQNSMELEAQLVPLGIELGRKLFGFAEFGVGTIFTGAQVGIGYKF